MATCPQNEEINWSLFREIVDKPDVVILSHQRSGTHFLQASLASHPKVRPRGEFLLQLKKKVKSSEAKMSALSQVESPVFRNQTGMLNIGIVMYSQMALFEPICGELCSYPVIHLTRNPWNVAQSIVQMKADRQSLGEAYRAHYHIGEPRPKPATFKNEGIVELEERVRSLQSEFRKRLSVHPHKLDVTYEELTSNQQVNTLSRGHCQRLLSFLRLPYVPLSNTLIKQASNTSLTEQNR